jgi:hypothetical protein
MNNPYILPPGEKKSPMIIIGIVVVCSCLLICIGVAVWWFAFRKTDGGLSPWVISDCVGTCGIGSQKYTRTCTKPTPKNKGKNCVADIDDNLYSKQEGTCVLSTPCTVVPDTDTDTDTDTDDSLTAAALTAAAKTAAALTAAAKTATAAAKTAAAVKSTKIFRRTLNDEDCFYYDASNRYIKSPCNYTKNQQILYSEYDKKAHSATDYKKCFTRKNNAVGTNPPIDCKDAPTWKYDSIQKKLVDTKNGKTIPVRILPTQFRRTDNNKDCSYYDTNNKYLTKPCNDSHIQQIIYSPHDKRAFVSASKCLTRANNDVGKNPPIDCNGAPTWNYNDITKKLVDTKNGKSIPVREYLRSDRFNFASTDFKLATGKLV